MTDLGTAPPAGATAPALGAARIPASPGARRLEPARWRDGRLLAGVLLLLVSVVVGARVLTAGGDSVPVVALARDVAAGHVLTADDVTTVQVHLGGAAAAQYIGASQLAAVPGRVMSRGARAGELLPAGALGDAGTTTPERLVGVTVTSGRLPGLSAGDHVDVYATGVLRAAGAVPSGAVPSGAVPSGAVPSGAVPSGATTTATATAGAAAQCTTQLIAADLEVGADVDPGSGSGSGTTTVLLRVDPSLAGTLVHAAATAELDITRHLPVGDAQGVAATAPVQGYDGLVTTACGK